MFFRDVSKLDAHFFHYQLMDGKNLSKDLFERLTNDDSGFIKAHVYRNNAGVLVSFVVQTQACFHTYMAPDCKTETIFINMRCNDVSL